MVPQMLLRITYAISQEVLDVDTPKKHRSSRLPVFEVRTQPLSPELHHQMPIFWTHSERHEGNADA